MESVEIGRLLAQPFRAECGGIGEAAWRRGGGDLCGDVFGSPRQIRYGAEDRDESLDTGQGWIGRQMKIIRDHGCVGGERRHFARERLQLRNLALEIRWLQSVPPPHAYVHVAIQRANAFRKAGEPLDQPRFFGEFLARPNRRLLDKTRIGY
jgi:hypothetical protein